MKPSTRGARVTKAENIALPKGIYMRGEYYWIRYGSGNGKTIRESSYCTDLKKAQNLLILRKADVLADKLPEIHSGSKKRSFGDLAKEYKDKVSVKKKSHYTEWCNIKVMLDFLTEAKLYKMNKDTVETIRDEIKKRGVKKSTINRYVATFKDMMTYAYEQKWINFSVLEDVRRLPMYPEIVPEVIPLTAEECKSLLEKAPEPIRLAIIIALYTGLRRKDILDMKWNNINFETGVISIIVAKTETTKKKVEHLRIHMSDTLRLFLENAERVSEYVVTQPNGKKYKTFKDSWERARKSINKPKLRLHDLRHTFASMLAMNGVDIYTISLMLDHSTIEMTKRYAHLAPDHKSRETKRLDTVMSFTPGQFDYDSNVVEIMDIELMAKQKAAGQSKSTPINEEYCLNYVI